MAKRKFGRNELDQHLENIEIFWHKHGDEQEGELIEYLEALFEALPRELRSDIVISAKDQIEVDLSLMEELLKGALSPVYTEAEISGEVSNVADRAIEFGGERSGNTLRTSSKSFDRAFREHFNADFLSDELAVGTEEVRKRLLEGAKRSKIAGDLPTLADDPEIIELQYSDFLEGVVGVRTQFDWSEGEAAEEADDFWILLESQVAEGKDSQVLTMSSDFFRERFGNRYLAEDAEVSEDEYSALEDLLNGLRTKITDESAE